MKEHNRSTLLPLRRFLSLAISAIVLFVSGGFFIGIAMAQGTAIAQVSTMAQEAAKTTEGTVVGQGPVIVQVGKSDPFNIYQFLSTWLAPSLLSGTALWFGNAIARRQQSIGWYKEFRELTKELWEGGEMEKVRTWIACDDAYEKIKPILQKRLDDGGVSEKEYETLDKIDRFCALLIRVLDMDTRPTTKEQERLWQSMYNEYWINKMSSRDELCRYVGSVWKQLPVKK